MVMGEYERLNNMLRQEEKRLKYLKSQKLKDYDNIMNCEIAIGEIKGALYEMSAIDGLEDSSEAFNYQGGKNNERKI